MDELMFCIYFIAIICIWYALIISVHTVYRYFFDRDKLMSFIKDEYIDHGEPYKVKYDFQGFPVSWKLNINHPKIQEQLKASRTGMK